MANAPQVVLATALPLPGVCLMTLHLSLQSSALCSCLLRHAGEGTGAGKCVRVRACVCVCVCVCIRGQGALLILHRWETSLCRPIRSPRVWLWEGAEGLLSTLGIEEVVDPTNVLSHLLCISSLHNPHIVKSTHSSPILGCPAF